MQNNINHSILAFLAIIAGFLILLSKLPYLYILGLLLFLGGIFLPFYDDLLLRYFHKDKAIISQTSRSRSIEYSKQTEDNKLPLQHANHMSTSQQVWVAQAPAAGPERAMNAAWSASRKLQAQLATTLHSGSNREPKITALKVEMSGNDLTQPEIDKAKDFLQLLFPKTIIQESILDTVVPDTSSNKENTGEFSVRLEAFVDVE